MNEHAGSSGIELEVNSSVDIPSPPPRDRRHFPRKKRRGKRRGQCLRTKRRGS
jgi:hypothetical protein